MLGPIRVVREGTELDLGSPQQRALLGLLLVRAGQPVQLSEIVDVLWGERPPASAVNVVHRYVGSLRRLLEPRLPLRAPGRWLIRRAGGYLLDTREEELDLLRFRDLARQGRRAVTTGRTEAAVALFAQALNLWRGPVASGLPASVLATPQFVAVGKEVVTTVRVAADAALLCGRTEQVLGSLRQAALLDPLNESLHSRLVTALAASGLQAEALNAYRDIRRRLMDDLGLAPSPELSTAHDRVLRQELPTPVVPRGDDDADDEPAGHESPAEPHARTEPGSPVVRPAQLPPGLAVFSGRRSELSRLLALTTETGASAATPVIGLISGMAGVGKTTLAVRWAHEVADRFPDGQLSLNLRGFDPVGKPVEPAEALRGFLHALGVAPRRLPAGLDALTGLYRSLLADRRVLVLLDNAHDADQVRPLLPASSGCLAIVTSRDQLAGLVASGARPLSLGLPSDTDARASLASRVGSARLAAEPEAGEEIIARCGRLPLALAVVAARAAGHPGFPLAAIAAELRRSHGSLDAFSGSGSADTRAAFSWSYRLLPPACAQLFRLLALHPGPDITVHAASALAALPARQARLMLGELATVHLLTEQAPGRYVFHDLLRAYAAELAAERDTETERRAAQNRLFDHYLHTAHAADQVLSANGNRLVLTPAQPGAAPESFTEHRDAQAWCADEYDVLMAAIRHALDTGFFTHAWQLSCSLHAFLYGQGRWQAQASALRTGVEAAKRDGDLLGQLTARRKLVRSLADLGEYDTAHAQLRLAFEAADQLGDTVERAYTHAAASWVLQRQGRHHEALDESAAAVRLHRAGGRRDGEATNLNVMGWLRIQLGDLRQAIVHSEEAVRLLRATGPTYTEAAVWDTMATAHYHLGEFERAIRCFHRSVELLPRFGDSYSEAGVWERLGDAYRDAGDPDAARDAWRRSVALFEGIERPEAEQVRTKLNQPAVRR
ncbi:tetratricopeptide repeat protein [Streptomyces sp. LP11]|uniref:Tetratricopeptide repeat protein n=1 Tax=Streptomyces pyxinicus TaxID=2970331 RepID=A0ABT2B8C2_9ACTN|nr:BTAD domain-containing putative transcriptional regulator [Streptomyces sp. LP11]MCS0604143.1 tetratricopeptide repeat protein [Streptomyces sp. LP11]